MTTWQIGTGGDYETWGAAITALPATLDDDYDLVQISDTVETGLSGILKEINMVSDGGGGFYNLTFRNASPHQGNPLQGYKSVCTDGNSIIYLKVSNGGTFEVKDLQLRKEGTGGSGEAIVIQKTEAAGNDPVVLLHDIIASVNNTASSQCMNLACNSGNINPFYCWNIVAEYGYETTVLLNNAGGCPFTLENITLVAAPVAGFDASNQVFTFRNCVVAEDGVLANFHNVGNSSGHNCAAADTSADDFSSWTSPYNSIVPATEFESLSIADANYAKVTNAGVCGAGGATPTIPGNTAGIRGNARSSSVGADEYAAPGGGGGGSGSGGGGISGAITAAMAAGY
jgi:hypothetical protein